VTFETLEGIIDETWFTVNTTALTIVMDQVEQLLNVSSVSVNINGKLVGDFMPEIDMDFKITV
jgi:hypothetical protein